MMITSYCLAGSMSALLVSRFEKFRLRTNPWSIYSNAVESGFRAEIERLAVFVSPREVVRIFRPHNRAEVLAFRRNNPKATGTGSVEIALVVDFHAVPSLFSRFT